MTLLVIGFLVALFTFIFWGLSSIYLAANEFDPLDPALSAFCEKGETNEG